MALFTVRVLAVGQGSCNLVQYRDDGGNLLCLGMIDCGSDDDDCKAVTIEYIRGLMEERAITVGEKGYKLKYYMDFLIVTHQDSDHLNWISEVFQGMNPPKLLKHVGSTFLYSTIYNSIAITYNNSNCTLVNMNRSLQAVYHKSSSSLFYAECEESGEIKFEFPSTLIHLGYSTISPYKTSMKYYPTGAYNFILKGSCEVSIDNVLTYEAHAYGDNFLLEFTFTLNTANIKVILNIFKFVYSFIFNNCETKKKYPYKGNMRNVCLSELIFDALKIIQKCIDILPKEEFTDKDRNDIKEYFCLAKDSLNAQLGVNSFVFLYGSYSKIVTEINEKQKEFGGIGLLSFGGSYNPVTKSSKIAQSSYSAISQLAFSEDLPYGCNSVSLHDFDHLKLRMFPYTIQFGLGGKRYKNHSSIISNVSYFWFGKHGATFTGDATITSMMAFNGSGYNSEFTNPLLMTAPHHGSISTATTKNKKGTDTSVMDKFLEIVHPKRIVVSHGYNNKHGHPNLTTMDHYTKYCGSGKEHYCFFNTTDFSPAYCQKKLKTPMIYRYGLTSKNIFTTVTALDKPTAGTKAGGKYVSYALNVKDLDDISLNNYEFLETNPLKYKLLNVCNGFEPATKKMLQARPFETTNTFLPPFIREI